MLISHGHSTATALFLPELNPIAKCSDDDGRAQLSSATANSYPDQAAHDSCSVLVSMAHVSTLTEPAQIGGVQRRRWQQEESSSSWRPTLRLPRYSVPTAAPLQRSTKRLRNPALRPAASCSMAELECVLRESNPDLLRACHYCSNTCHLENWSWVVGIMNFTVNLPSRVRQASGPPWRAICSAHATANQVYS